MLKNNVQTHTIALLESNSLFEYHFTTGDSPRVQLCTPFWEYVMSQSPNRDYKQCYRFMLTLLSPFKKLIIIQLGIMTFWAFDLNFRPYLLKIIIDVFSEFKPNQPFIILLKPALCYIGMFLLVIIFHALYDLVWINIRPPLRKNVIESLTGKMMGHSQELFNHNLAGSLANKIRDVTKSFPDLVFVAINNFYSCFFAVVFAIINLALIHIHCALMLTTWITIFLLGTFFLSGRTRRYSSISAEIHSEIIGRIVDVFSNILNVRLFCSAPFESRKLKRMLNQYVTADQTRDKSVLYLYMFQSLSFVIYQAACIIWLVYQFQHDGATAGDFVMVLTLNSALSDLLWDISDNLSTMSDHLGNIFQGLNIALTPVSMKDSPHAVPLQVTEGKIVFESINFSYNKAKPLFKNKSITIEAGQKVGLVGYSGSGKSTFINLILRLFDVQNGKILIDGQNIKDVTQKSLHEAISLIPQDPCLFHRSLLENIHYGKLSAPEKEVIKAAQSAHAHDFIKQLPEGYNTLAGEHGTLLSGGQRQRIIIARAMLKNAPILLLDEATSQMDSITENEIQQSLWHLMQGKTTLVIAHRLSTLLHMDRILVFEQGKVVGDGTHAQLLATNLLYKTLWQTQVNGFLTQPVTSTPEPEPVFIQQPFNEHHNILE